MTKAGLNGQVVNIPATDIKIMAPKDIGMIDRVKVELTFSVSMIDTSPISFYLGLKVEHDRENQTIKLS